MGKGVGVWVGARVGVWVAVSVGIGVGVSMSVAVAVSKGVAVSTAARFVVGGLLQADTRMVRISPTRVSKVKCFMIHLGINCFLVCLT